MARGTAEGVPNETPHSQDQRQGWNGADMTTIHYWCPLHRAYVQRTVPTALAFKLVGLT